MHDPSCRCDSNLSLCTYAIDGQNYHSDSSHETDAPIKNYDGEGNLISGKAKRQEGGADTIPILFGFDTTNATDADKSILNDMIVDRLPGQAHGKAMFRNDKAGFEAEGLMTGVKVSDDIPFRNLISPAPYGSCPSSDLVILQDEI